MALFLNLLITGVLLGSGYALMGMALTLMVGVIGIIDFSQGAWVMLASYLSYQLARWMHLSNSPAYYLAGAIAVAIVYVLGLAVYTCILQPIFHSESDQRRRHLRQLVVTLGVSLVISALIELVWTSNAVYIQWSPSVSLGGGVSISVTGLITLVGALCVVGLVAYLLYRTRLGTQIRAVADNPTSALMFGISTRRISLHSYAIALAVSAAAGALIAPDISILPNVGQWYLLVGAGVMAIAAFRSLRLAVVGGLAVGVVSQLSLLKLSSDLQSAIIFVIILASLFTRFWLAKLRARRVRLPEGEEISSVAT